MITHPDTVVALATTRHLETLAECERARLAAQATTLRPPLPGFLTATRMWLGSVLIDMGQRLQGMTAAGKPAAAFGGHESAGNSRSGDGASGKIATLLPT